MQGILSNRIPCATRQYSAVVRVSHLLRIGQEISRLNNIYSPPLISRLRTDKRCRNTSPIEAEPVWEALKHHLTANGTREDSIHRSGMAIAGSLYLLEYPLGLDHHAESMCTTNNEAYMNKEEVMLTEKSWWETFNFLFDRPNRKNI